MQTDITITLTDAPPADALARIGEQLSAFNDADAGPANRRALAVIVRDGAGTILAGINGYTAWGWLYVQWLWVDESLRGQRMAGRMLEAAETEARARGCHAAYIDTFNPVALKTYQRQGYVEFGTLPDFPPGRTRVFLQKPLN